MERLSGYALSGALLRLWTLPEAFGGLAELHMIIPRLSQIPLPLSLWQLLAPLLEQHESEKMCIHGPLFSPSVS
jgi:hypothetical protein